MLVRGILGLVFILPMAFTCVAQSTVKPSKRTRHQAQRDSLDSVSEIGWQEVYDSLPILKMMAISDTQFLAYKRAYHSPVVLDSSRVLWGDSTFSIRTSKALLTYDNLDVSGGRSSKDCQWFYQGYHPELDLYFLSSHWHVEFVLGFNLWIDGRRNVGVRHVAYSDGAFPVPVFSPDNRYLVIFAQSLEPSCFLGVVQIIKDKRGLHFHEVASASTAPVQELVWINEHAFALHVKQELDYNRKTGLWDYQDLYWKASLPGSEGNKDRPSR